LGRENLRKVWMDFLTIPGQDLVAPETRLIDSCKEISGGTSPISARL
jgi:hypothetical protein